MEIGRKKLPIRLVSVIYAHLSIGISGSQLHSRMTREY